MDNAHAQRLLLVLLIAGINGLAWADSGAGTEPGHKSAVLKADENPDAPVNQVFSYYTVSGATLRGRSSTVATTYANTGCVYLSAGTASTLLLNTDLPVPQGSLIKYLRIYYYDTNPSNGVSAYITRYTPGSATADLTSVTSTAAFVAGYGTSLSAELTELVDGTADAYTLIGWPDVAASSNRICGMRVAYYGPNFFANGFESP